MKNYAFIAGYRRFWYNLHALVDITTKEGTKTITEAIQRLEKMAADIGLSILPAMAILPNVLTLWFVLEPVMGATATIPLVAMIETIPFVFAYYVFRIKDNEALKQLLVGYYAIIFALTIAFKVFPPEGVSLQSVAWLLIPCISVVAMLGYGKIRSVDIDEPQTEPYAPQVIDDTTPEAPEPPESDVVVHRPIRPETDVEAITKRREKVKKLHSEGMSQRAIAKEIGVGQSTVRRDLAA